MPPVSNPPLQKSIADAHKLLQILTLVENSIRSVIAAWANPAVHPAGIAGTENVASWDLFNAQRVLLSATGVLTELVANPSSRLLEVSSQYNESRALHIAAEMRMPDKLAEGGEVGVSVQTLSESVGIEARKLCTFALFARAGSRCSG